MLGPGELWPGLWDLHLCGLVKAADSEEGCISPLLKPASGLEGPRLALKATRVTVTFL